MAGKTYLHDTDVDEWRYTCNTCGSHTIEVRTKLGWPKEHNDVNPTPLQPHSSPPTDFRCHVCGTTSNVLYDKKERETVTKHQIDL